MHLLLPKLPTESFPITFLSRQRGLEPSSIFWRDRCGSIPGSLSTRRRRRCGIGVGVSLQRVLHWRGDSELPTHQQGFKVHGIPLGHPDFVQRFLEGKIAEHRVLLERIPEVPDTQSAWSFCAAAGANFFLRGVNPDHAKWSAAAHAQGLSSLPMWEGGTGLRSARRTQPAAHWASWTDALKMVKERHPVVAGTILGALESGAETSSIQAILKCSRIFHDAGFESPAWGALAEGRALEVVEEEEDPCQPRLGWQQKASSAIKKHHFKASVWPQLLEHERAMMRSQSGPLASTLFDSFPVDRTSRIDAGPFRALLLRRLGLPFPLSVRSCRCGRLLDALGHHRAACATAGVLGRRGWALELVAARVCREGGARVRANVFVRDMDLAEHSRLDCRRLEVVADGLPLFGGVQLAIDTTMVSPLHRDGRASLWKTSQGTDVP